MHFDNFGMSRDLLYLCSLFLGAALAAFLVTLRKKCSLRLKSIMITVILLLCSLCIAALAGSIILSRGLIFSVSLLYPYVALFFILGGLALYFPRAGGCTMIFFLGIFAVYICFSFLIYPGLKEPERLIIRSSGAELIFRRDAETWEIPNNPGVITFKAVSITANPAYPLIGGEKRGLITQVLQNENDLFTLAFSNSRYSGGLKKPWGFLREEYTLDLPSGSLLPGISLSVLFNGSQLFFDPPIQL